MAGKKPESFTDAENAALRAAFRRLQEMNGWSQAEAGRQLEIGQQAAGRILNRNGGFSRMTAERLATKLGYESANALVREAGATPNPMTVPQGWVGRDLAVSIARRLEYPEEVLRRVVVKFQESQHATKPARWWNDRIVAEAAELAALGVDPPPTASPSSLPPAVHEQHHPKKRRKAG